jgi:hypothetical protein
MPPTRSQAARQLKKATFFLQECRDLWNSRDLRDSSTWADATKYLKTRLIHFLLQLGPEFADIYGTIESLNFVKTISQRALDEFGEPTARFESLEIVNVGKVRTATKLLITVAKRLKGKCPPNETGTGNLKSTDASPRKPLSEKDAKLHAALAPEVFRTLTNDEIGNAHRRKLESIIGRTNVEGFRARLKRIRAFYGYPSSKDVGNSRRLKLGAVKNGQKH